MRDVETCAQALPYFILESCDNGLGFFAGEEDFCDQEGCSEKATVTYKVKEEFSAIIRMNGISHSQDL